MAIERSGPRNSTSTRNQRTSLDRRNTVENKTAKKADLASSNNPLTRHNSSDSETDKVTDSPNNGITLARGKILFAKLFAEVKLNASSGGHGAAFSVPPYKVESLDKALKSVHIDASSTWSVTDEKSFTKTMQDYLEGFGK